jgi:hypothetical protein
MQDKSNREKSESAPGQQKDITLTRPDPAGGATPETLTVKKSQWKTDKVALKAAGWKPVDEADDVDEDAGSTGK